MELNEAHCHSDVLNRKEKVEAALAKLQSLKLQISELRVQCEALKELQSEKKLASSVCSICAKPIKQGEEVTLKDFHGKVKNHYHKDCFKAIWLSQTWKFDYSSPGFLRLSEKGE